MRRQIAQALLVPVLCFVLAGCTTESSVYGLKPEYPSVRHSFFSPDIAYLTVNSLQPVLKWEQFPRAQDSTLMGRISNVTYELHIWKIGEENHDPELVYEEKGIAGPSHKIGHSLEASTKYLWSVRAKFELDGKPRVTEWGRPQLGKVRRPNVFPDLYFYRFQTPFK